MKAKRGGRPRRSEPARKFGLTLGESEHALLVAYAQELGQPATRVAGELLRKVLAGPPGTDGQVTAAKVEAMLRLLRGEPEHPPQVGPRWEWPIEVILAEGRWWDRWLPELNELLGRQLIDKDDRRSRASITDRRGYADLLEFLFPALSVDGQRVSWRSAQYPHLVRLTNLDGELWPIWESVIRHVVVALEALANTAEPGAEPGHRILIQDQITGPWLRSLKSLLGEGPRRETLPLRRLT